MILDGSQSEEINNLIFPEIHVDNDLDPWSSDSSSTSQKCGLFNSANNVTSHSLDDPQPSAAPNNDRLLYILVEKASGLYFVDGDEPCACVTVECNGYTVKKFVCWSSFHFP
jgi:hypothetical protein